MLSKHLQWNHLRYVSVALLVVLCAFTARLPGQGTSGAAPEASGPAPPAARGLVLVELFTSEGCPHCPEADAMLERMYTEQSVEGVQIVPIEEHVDYWDRAEWVDRFSSSSYTQRQKTYADAMDLDSVYTPQMVVDGLVEFVGSNEGRARATISALGHAPVGALQFEPVGSHAAARSPAELQVHLEGHGITLEGPATVYLALVEDKLVSRVAGGSNSGENWKHSSVARWFYRVGKLAADEKTFSAGLALSPPDPEWHPENLRLIAIVQEEVSRKVAAIGVASWSEVVAAPKSVPAASGAVSASPSPTSNAPGPQRP